MEIWKNQTLTRNKVIVPACILRVVYDFVYCSVSARYWSYAGLTVDFDLSKYLLSWLGFIIAMLFIPIRSGKSSSVMLQWLFLLGILPICSFFGLSSHAMNESSPIFFVVVLIGYIFGVLLINLIPDFSIKQPSRTAALFDYLLPAILFFIVGATFIYCGIHVNVFTNMMTTEIYDIRASVNMPVILSVLFTMSYRAICPILLIVSLAKHRYNAVVLYCFIQIIMYMLVPNKEIVFSLLLCLLAYYFLKRDLFYKGMTIVLCISLFISAISALGFNFLDFAAIVPNRLMAYPAQNEFEHFAFFSQNELLYYSESSLGKLLGLHYPYGEYSSGQIVGFFFHQTQTNSNVGFWGYGYDDFGFIGVILASVLVSLVLKLFDSLDCNQNLVAACALYPVTSLINVSTTASLVSGGILASLFLLAILDKDYLGF